jgi:hypothetical protein
VTRGQQLKASLETLEAKLATVGACGAPPLLGALIGAPSCAYVTVH